MDLIKSRFFTKEEANEQCPNGLRLLFKNHLVDHYNEDILNAARDKVISVARDIFSSYNSAEQLARVRQQ